MVVYADILIQSISSKCIYFSKSLHHCSASLISLSLQPAAISQQFIPLLRQNQSLPIQKILVECTLVWDEYPLLTKSLHTEHHGKPQPIATITNSILLHTYSDPLPNLNTLKLLIDT